MRSDLERELADALRPVTPVADGARRDALERELLARLSAQPRGGVPNPAPSWSRWALATGLGGALAVAACALPSDYAAPLGHRLAIVVDLEHASTLDPEQLVEFVTEHHHPDQLTMAVALERTREQGQDGTPREHASMRIEIDAVGEHLDAEMIWDDLVEAFPELDGARLEDEELRGMVHGTLGGRLSNAWLDVVIDRGGVEQAKQQVIDQLRAQGVEGDAQVDIVDAQGDDGRRRREVRVIIDDEHHP